MKTFTSKVQRCNFLICLCLFSFVATTYAQQTTHGYIVTYQGDTLQGKIVNEDWDESPTMIHFKAESAKDYQDLSVTEISAFGLSDQQQMYVARNATMLIVTEGFVYKQAPYQVSSRRVFLQTLLQGKKATVYRLRAKNQRVRYFVEKDGDLLELINQPYLQGQSNGKVYSVQNDLYKTQLLSLCSDTDKFDVSNLPGYDEASIIRYFSRYNACFLGETIVYKVSEAKAQIHLGLTAGIEPNIAAFSDVAPPAHMTRGTFGFSVRYSLPRRYNNRYIKLGLVLVPSVPFAKESVYGYYLSNQTLKFIAFSVGSYIGTGAWKPYFEGNFTLARPYNAGFVSASVGVSYKREFDIEVGPLLRLGQSTFNPNGRLTPPRISIHYYISCKKN